MFVNKQKFWITRFILILAITVSLVGIYIRPAVAASGDTTLVTQTIDPSHRVQSMSSSFQTSISADGRYVAFASDADNLVSYDENGVSDIFVYDRQADEMERVSIASDGVEANAASLHPSLSADGRYVTFQSNADNLVSGDINNSTDIFVHDRDLGITERVSIASNGSQANGDSVTPSIAADGHHVVFQSSAFSLVIDDTNYATDIFVHDRDTGITVRVSVASNGAQANGNSAVPTISADGRYIVFSSSANNLVDGDINGSDDIFVHDFQTGETERVSVAPDGMDANAGSATPSISAEGRYVAFRSDASNLVSDDANGVSDVFTYDRQTDETVRASVASDGTEANNSSSAPSISADGYHIAFVSNANNLVSDDTNSSSDIFVFDRQTGSTERASVNSSGGEANHNSLSPSISDDGHDVAFESLAGNLGSVSDTNEASDIYVRDREQAETKRISVGLIRITANSSSGDPAVSADGRYVAFSSSASDLVSGDTNGKTDIFVYDHQTGVMERLNPSSGEGNGASSYPSISGDGRYVAFYSQATNLVSDDTNGQADVFVYDRDTGVTERVSVASDGTQANKYSQQPSISANGRYAVFQSYATNLISDDSNNYPDIFIHDRDTGVTERVSVASGGTQVWGDSYEPAISADGRYIAFYSYATTLVSGDTNLKSDVFVRDRDTGLIERISIVNDGSQTNDASIDPSISADGRYVAFDSFATNLVSDDTNSARDVFVYDRDMETIERISVSSNGIQAQQNSASPSISADGRYVAFWSSAGNLVSGDTNGEGDIFIRDRDAGMTVRVSVASGGKQANGSSVYPSLSGDGHYVAFSSAATNLANGDGNDTYDLFLHENDIPPTIVGIARADSDPTSAAMVDFTVTFSEPVSNVDESDFLLNATGGITGANINNVIPDDACTATLYCDVYTVTVNTGSGNGTLRLDGVDDNTILDAAGNPLSGVHAGDGGFTSGEVYDVNKTMTIWVTNTKDGWILESSETSRMGGTMNKTAITLNLGDNAANKQYRSILSFDTSSLPDHAVITSVTLKFKYAGKTGTLPFSTHGNLLVDIRKGAFSNNSVLQLSDFEAAASKNKVLIYTHNLVDHWYSQSFNSADFPHLNLRGTTQFRLRFAKDDNNDFGADFLKIFSGNAPLESDRPQLIIEYYVP